MGIFFCYLNGQHFSFQKSESNSFHKGLGTIHIRRHHPVCGGGEVKLLTHGSKKIADSQEGGSKNRKKGCEVIIIWTALYELFCYCKNPMTNPSFSQNFGASSSYFLVNILDSRCCYLAIYMYIPMY